MSILCVIGLIIIGVSLFTGVYSRIKMERDLQNAAEEAKANKNLEAHITKYKDMWDQPIIVTAEQSKGCVIYTSHSAGIDRIPGTKDDLTHQAVDVNWSCVIGYQAGKMAKEAGKGFIEGLKAKTIFKDKEDDTQN